MKKIALAISCVILSSFLVGCDLQNYASNVSYEHATVVSNVSKGRGEGFNTVIQLQSGQKVNLDANDDQGAFIDNLIVVHRNMGINGNPKMDFIVNTYSGRSGDGFSIESMAVSKN